MKFFSAGVFGISHVHVADDIDDAAVRLFGEAFVLATVARFHVENRDMQALCRNCRKAAVGIAKNKHRIRLASDHKLVAAIDDVTYGCAEIVVVQQRTMTELDLHPQERTFKIHLFLQKLMQYYPVSIIHQEKHSFWVD